MGAVDVDVAWGIAHGLPANASRYGSSSEIRCIEKACLQLINNKINIYSRFLIEPIQVSAKMAVHSRHDAVS
jgi:hypothetical protein